MIVFWPDVERSGDEPVATIVEVAVIPEDTPIPEENKPEAKPPNATPSFTPTLVPLPSSPTPSPLPTRTNTPISSLTPTPVLGIGTTQISPKDSMVLVYIPAGDFKMGSEDGDSDERPVHTVYLDAYWMDQTEVTNAMYAEFLNDQGNQTEGGATWLDAADEGVRIIQSGDTWGAESGFSDHPVVEATWYGAKAYCQWSGRQLPTEAEWEKAARGGLEGKEYPWGEENPVCTPGAQSGAQYSHCDGGTVTVKTFAPNGYSLFDMAGNVWEWVMDWYQGSYYQGSPNENPTGPEDGASRGLRGGSWGGNDNNMRVANRSSSNPSSSHDSVGFRCVSAPGS